MSPLTLAFVAPATAVALLFVSGCQSPRGTEAVSHSDYPPPVLPAAVPAPVAAPPAAPAAPAVPATASVIRPGDSLEVFVEEDAAFNGTYVVRENGDIMIRAVGRIPVAGLTVGEAGPRVRTELESRHLRKATVMIDRVARALAAPATVASLGSGGLALAPQITVYITGRVNRPGQHVITLPANGRVEIYETILMTGGFATFAHRAKTHVLRNDGTGTKQLIPVNLIDIEQGRAPNFALGDGDIVVVPEKVFGF
jgi:protein involved in polysaccharide export with SLBB domain